MEIVVMLIMILVAVSFALKLTCHKFPAAIALSALTALFVWQIWPYAITQSKTQIADWLSQPDLMLDTSVLLTVDVFLQITFCVLSINSWAKIRTSRAVGIIRTILLWVPGILIFPVLFSALVEIIFATPGVDFALVGRTTAIAVLILFPTAAWLLRYILPETELRLELMFLVNVLIAALGIVATVNGRTAATGTNSVEWGALAGVLAILLAGALAGIVINRYITKRKLSKMSKI